MSPRHFVARLANQTDPPDPVFGGEYFMTDAIDAHLPGSDPITWDPATLGVGGLTVRFPEGVRLFARQEFSAVGVNLTAIDDQEPWGGIVVAGSNGQLDLTDGSVVEHADAGVAVYAPARANLDGAALHENGVGLAVYSDGDDGQPGALVEDSDIVQNGIGVFTDFTCTWDSGTLPTCNQFNSTESWLSVTGSTISNNDDEGILALNADVDVTQTDIDDNGADGITLVNTTASTFQLNRVRENGNYGIGVLVSGEFFGSPTTAPGENTISGNASTEVWVHDSGSGFLGSSTGNGRNAILDGSGGLLVRYSASADPGLNAGYQWWGSSSFNPASVFSGDIDYCPFYTCNPVGNPSCTQTSCDQFHAGGGTVAVSAGGRLPPTPGSTSSQSSGFGFDFIAELGAEVREIRARILARPADGLAPRWIRRLGYLHVLDAMDESGERTESFVLLRSLREALSGTSVPEGVRASAEAALEVESFAALSRKEYDAADLLLDTYASRVEGETVQRHLALVRALLLSREGRREEASVLVASLAVTAGDPEEGRALHRLAGALAWSPGRSEGIARVPGEAIGASPRQTEAGVTLSIGPNPVRDRAAITIEMPAESHVRLSLYDLLGREVLIIGDAALVPGTHILTLAVASLPPGVYAVRAMVQAGNEVLARRITVVR